MVSRSVIVFPDTAKRPTRERVRQLKCKTNFSQIGGLSRHLELLREIIIMPLLYADLYKHFNIKPPRGVIFYGPPGTGKTLVAGALAAEIGRQAGGKVAFYNRKGADILDKWVGESERKLRELFDKARKTRPSLIFFDELDGLAPERSSRNDQVHASVVTTLLALMDGLDDASGVIVIGATNRIECVDPALRRPGRFDRELYFPLPNTQARKEILTVHTKTWRHKPTSGFLEQLAELTCGCCGSDLQAICAEAVMRCVKRKYPTLSQLHSRIDFDVIKVSEEDFNNARSTIAPSMLRTNGCRYRKLTPFIRPLLQRQVDKIVGHIEIILPHFLDANKKYTTDGNRYAGRLLLKGNSQQGLNSYVIPALLQRFEHMNANVLDVPENYARVMRNAFQTAPSIMVLARVDDWWDVLESSAQMAVISMLEDLHAGLPIMVVVSFTASLPPALHAHFVFNSSICIEMDNPTVEERRAFFSPLFFGKNCMSLWRVLHGGITSETKREVNENDAIILPRCTRVSLSRSKLRGSNRQNKAGWVCKRPSQNCRTSALVRKQNGCRRNRQNHIAVWLQSMITRTAGSSLNRPRDESQLPLKTILKTEVKEELDKTCALVTSIKNIKLTTKNTMTADEEKIRGLWKRTANLATADLPVVHLELLYDALLACIFINTNNFAEAYNGMAHTLSSFEKL